MIRKLDPTTPCFTKVSAGAISIKAGTQVFVAGRLITFAAATAAAIDTGALAAGTDYALYVTAGGLVLFSANHTSPTGYTTTSAAKIGGFHYANGGNAAAQAGGDATPAINEYSIWDEKFRPTSSDPRGMTLVAGAFWADIYLLGNNQIVDGSSKFGATIADGSSPPKIATLFGGNSTDTYGALKWWHANEVAVSVGKQLLSYAEFCAATFGTTEQTNVTGGLDPVTTQRDTEHTSKWGLMQATGNMWIWGAGELLNPTTPTVAAWLSTGTGIDARGSMYIYGAEGIKMPLFGGDWGTGAYCGSRSVYWNYAPSYSSNSIGARFRCDHLLLP